LGEAAKGAFFLRSPEKEGAVLREVAKRWERFSQGFLARITGRALVPLESRFFSSSFRIIARGTNNVNSSVSKKDFQGHSVKNHRVNKNLYLI